MNSKITMNEYESSGKDFTQKALVELQEQLKNFKPNKVEYSDIESYYSDDEDNIFEVSSVRDELSKFKLENPINTSNAKKKVRDRDKYIVMFEEVMDRNNILTRKNVKLEHKIKKISGELTIVEIREHNKQVFANSKTIENDDLIKQKKFLEKCLNTKSEELVKYERINYIGRFLIGTQFLIMIYMYVVLNADKFLLNTKNLFE